MQFVQQLLEVIQPKEKPNSIRQGRILKERSLSQELKWANDSQINFSCHGSNCQIILPLLYPFQQPHISFQIEESYYSIKNLEDIQPYDYYFTAKWTPQLTVQQMADNCKQLAESTIQNLRPYHYDIYSDMFTKFQNYAPYLIILFINLLLNQTRKMINEDIKLDLYDLSNWLQYGQPIKLYLIYFIDLFQLDSNIQAILFSFIMYGFLYLFINDSLRKFNWAIRNSIIFCAFLNPLLISSNQLIVGFIILSIWLMKQDIWIGALSFTVLYNLHGLSILLLPLAINLIGRLSEFHGLISKYNLHIQWSRLPGLLFELSLLCGCLIILQLAFLYPWLYQLDFNFSIQYEWILVLILYIPCIYLQILGEEMSMASLNAYIIYTLIFGELDLCLLSALFAINIQTYKYELLSISILSKHYSYIILQMIFNIKYFLRNSDLIAQFSDRKMNKEKVISISLIIIACILYGNYSTSPLMFVLYVLVNWEIIQKIRDYNKKQKND